MITSHNTQFPQLCKDECGWDAAGTAERYTTYRARPRVHARILQGKRLSRLFGVSGKLYSLVLKDMKSKDTICPVCGDYSFEFPDDYDICPFCGWENDGVQGIKKNIGVELTV